MKALTLTQPWASLVALGAKRIETRSWSTNYRGPIAIHAAKGPPKGLKLGGRLEVGDFEVERARSGLLLRGPISWPYRLPLGEVVAVAVLEDVVPTDHEVDGGLLWSRIWTDDPDDISMLTEDGWWRHGGDPVAHNAQRPYGDFTPGRFAWLLGNQWVLRKPVPAKGALGLWEWEAPEGTPMREERRMHFAYEGAAR